MQLCLDYFFPVTIRKFLLETTKDIHIRTNVASWKRVAISRPYTS